MATQLPTVTIVIPAYNAETTIAQVIEALEPEAEDREVLVVDPGSSDKTAEVARSLGAEALLLGRRAGPAESRNIGVEHVKSEVILFIDSDCVPKADVVERVREAFGADPDLVSLTGSYDDDPPDPGFFSQYMNLRHHLTHQTANRHNATFWAGLGAVRREAFVRVGGFDAKRFPEPQIEDIELGLRLAPLGRRSLDPDLQVKHLKRWTFQSVVETDIRCRAIPWSRLILEHGDLPNDLNLRSSQRLAGAIAPLVLLAVVGGPLAGLGLLFPRLNPGPPNLAALIVVGSFLVVALSLLLSSRLVRGFARIRGLRFALGGWLFHQLHLTYSAVTFTICSLLHRLRR